jgi:hypothetical protein
MHSKTDCISKAQYCSKMSAELFSLIHALSKAERRFLSLYADLGAGRAHNSTLQLLNVMADMPAWDEDALVQRLQKKALADNLSSHKTRLLNLILKSQRLQRSDDSVISQLHGLLEDIGFLVSKGQLRLAKKRLDKTKALASGHEEHAIALQVLAWEQRIFIQTAQGPEQIFFDRLEQDERHHLERLSLQQGLLRQHSRIRSLLRTVARARKPEEREAFRAILLDPVMLSPPPEDAFFATALFLQIRGTYHLAMGETEHAWLNFHLLMQRWERYAHQIEHRSDLYLGSLNNYLSTCISDPKYYPHFLKNVLLARQVTGISPETRLKLERVVFTQELAFRMNFKTLAESVAFVAELEAWLESKATALEPARLLHLYYNLAQFHFVYGSYKPANRWLQKIVHFPDTDARQDIRDFARVFQLVLQYELGNLDLQEYLLRSATRYLRREDKVFELETALLDWVKTMQKSSSATPAASLPHYKALLQKLLPLADASTGRLPLGLNEIIMWAESKVQGMPIGDYVTKKMFGA